jgi:histidine kinase
MIVPGFTIAEELYRSGHTAVHRARRKDGGAVLLRTPINPRNPSDAAKLRHEHEILGLLGKSSKLEALDPNNTIEGNVYLVTDDPGGIPLAGLIGESGMDLASCLWIASALIDAIGDVHRKRVLHKEVSPRNVLVDAAARHVSLVGHSLASRLSRETRGLMGPDVLEGDLPCISPEQTGRMNRAVDYRTDFYSFGATLYQMLTGQPVVKKTEPMEIVHAHIALAPPSPREISRSVPEVLSTIVMKLLAKDAEDRYQSVRGIKADLEQCAAELAQRGSIGAFVIGTKDQSDVFQVPQKLYGREPQISALMEAFERAAAGRLELVLVSGYSGIGKSALVREIHKPVVGKRGYFVSGKYEQYKRDIPYLALSRAFQELIRQILTGSAESVAAFRARLTEALGPNGPIIVDVIPEVGLVLGEQEAPPELGPSESEARLRAAFQSFVEVCAAADHPLVLFLDDLQWADSASLKLIKLLLGAPEGRSLLLVGSYRDNEVDPAHPLSMAIEEIERSGAPVTHVKLGPLGLSDVIRLVADTVRADPTRAAPLAELCLEKTNGNPFFLIHFLQALHDERLLSFDASAHRWQWNVGEIRRKASTDNVVDLMVNKLQRLPERARRAVMLAACIGSQFDLLTLAAVADRSPADAADDLWEAVREGQVLPLSGDLSVEAQRTLDLGGEGEGLGGRYRFLHDRVQQAARSLLSPAERAAANARIGRMLLAMTPAGAIEERVFDIVNHLDDCIDLVDTPAERRRLAELNLIAGRKAKASTAYDVAFRYLTIGLDLLPETSWETDYDLTASLHLLRSECEYLLGRSDDAEKSFDLLILHARTAREKVRVHTRKTVLYRHGTKYADAVKTAIEGLSLLGLSMPAPSEPDKLQAFAGADVMELQELLKDREIAALIDLPAMSDPDMLAMMGLLEELSILAMFFGPALVQAATFKMVVLSLKHGNARASAAAYVTYGMLVGSGMGDFKSGFAFGKLALELSRRLKDPIAECKSSFWHGALISHWREHIGAGVALLKEACDLGVRGGDPVDAGYAAFFTPIHSYARGDALDDVLAEVTRYRRYMDPETQQSILAWRQLAMALKGMTKGGGSFDGEAFSESEYVDKLGKTCSPLAMQHYFSAKVQALYLLDRPAEAAAMIARAEAAGDLMMMLFAQLATAEWAFFRALVRLAEADAAATDEAKQAAIALAKKDEERLVVWAENSPASFRHKRLLVAAELARVEGRPQDAVDPYEDALESARAHGFFQHQALIAELAGRFHLGRGRRSLARGYLTAAHEGYVRWGATAKARMLEEKHPDQLAGLGAQGAEAAQGGMTLDLSAVLRASQTMSGEIVLERLLQQVMRLMIESAGAERGYFVLEREGRLSIQAEGAVGAEVAALQDLPVEQCEDLSAGIVNYVKRTGDKVVLDDAAREGRFQADPYVARKKPRSVLCAPIIKQKKRVGILYLENNLVAGAFTPARLRVLEVLSTQAAISLENAWLYDTLEQKVEQRTEELSLKNVELESALVRLSETQSQLVIQEKLASLGALTAGIAHEIKNPLNFVNNFAELTVGLAGEIEDVIRGEAPRLGADTVTDLEESLDLLRQNVTKISEHGKRANTIVNSMLLHSRGATGAREPSNLNAIVAESVSLAYHGMRGKDPSFNISIDARYDDAVGLVEVVSQDMSRVFINVINNACDATRQKRREKGGAYAPVLTIRTESRGDKVVVSVGDNGTGIAPEILDRIYNPFFTTKPPGEGTGLGLSISHDIVVGGHQGTIEVHSTPGESTEFTIVLPRTAPPKEEERPKSLQRPFSRGAPSRG